MNQRLEHVKAGSGGRLASSREPLERLVPGRQAFDEDEREASVRETERALGKQPSDPPRGGAVEARMSLARHQHQHLERIVELQVLQLGRGQENDRQATCLQRAPESRMGAPLDRHERMFARATRPPDKVGAGEPRGRLARWRPHGSEARRVPADVGALHVKNDASMRQVRGAGRVLGGLGRPFTNRGQGCPTRRDDRP